MLLIQLRIMKHYSILKVQDLKEKLLLIQQSKKYIIMYYLMLALYLRLMLQQKLGEMATTLLEEKIIKKLRKLKEKKKLKNNSQNLIKILETLQINGEILLVLVQKQLQVSHLCGGQLLLLELDQIYLKETIKKLL